MRELTGCGYFEKLGGGPEGKNVVLKLSYANTDV